MPFSPLIASSHLVILLGVKLYFGGYFQSPQALKIDSKTETATLAVCGL
jgi:hypothetical protein